MPSPSVSPSLVPGWGCYSLRALDPENIQESCCYRGGQQPSHRQRGRLGKLRAAGPESLVARLTAPVLEDGT